MIYTLITGPVVTYETRHSHSLKDEIFYFGFMVKENVDFKFYTSAYSVKRIRSLFPEHAFRVLNSQNEKINLSEKERVIFLGYTEVDVALFVFMNLFSNPKFVLVATNNFSKARCIKYHWVLRLFFFVINPFLHCLVLHSNFESKLVLGVSSRLSKKLFIKKHHMMSPINVESARSLVSSSIITFFGPNKFDKSVDPLLELIKADVKNVFQYDIYSVEIECLIDILPDIEERENVKIHMSRQNDQEYQQIILSSQLIFLGHTPGFEGKLSGNFCDCVANATPFLARKIEPLVYYTQLSGSIGYLVDFDQSGWAEEFLNIYCKTSVLRMRDNLSVLAMTHSLASIELDLRSCLIEGSFIQG